MPQRINLNQVLRGPGNTDDTETNAALLAGTFLAAPAQPATAVVVAGASTITPTTSVTRLAPAGAVTGVILANGTYNGQIAILVNTSAAASTITFNATPATSHIDNASVVIAGKKALILVWDAIANFWYPTVLTAAA